MKVRKGFKKGVFEFKKTADFILQFLKTKKIVFHDIIYICTYICRIRYHNVNQVTFLNLLKYKSFETVNIIKNKMIGFIAKVRQLLYILCKT